MTVASESTLTNTPSLDANDLNKINSSQSDSSEHFYGLLTVLLSVFIIGTIYLISQYSKLQTRVAIEQIFPSGIPKDYILLNSFQTKGGKVAELLHSASATKFRLALSTTEEPLAIGDSFVFDKSLKDYSKHSILPDGIPVFLSKFSSAQYDYRRVANFQAVPLIIKDQEYKATSFLSSKSIFYLALFLESKTSPAFIIAERKEQEVDQKLFAEFIQVNLIN